MIAKLSVEHFDKIHLISSNTLLSFQWCESSNYDLCLLSGVNKISAKMTLVIVTSKWTSGNHLVLLSACNFIVLQRQYKTDIILHYPYLTNISNIILTGKIIQFWCLTRCEAGEEQTVGGEGSSSVYDGIKLAEIRNKWGLKRA